MRSTDNLKVISSLSSFSPDGNWNGTTWSLEAEDQKDLKNLEKFEILGWFL
jgi:hypothetical protein